MAQANEGANLLRDAVTRIPIYTGDGNDAFTPNQWINRIQKPGTLQVGMMPTQCHLCTSPLGVKHSNGMNV